MSVFVGVFLWLKKRLLELAIPASALLLGAGLIGLVGFRRKVSRG